MQICISMILTILELTVYCYYTVYTTYTILPYVGVIQLKHLHVKKNLPQNHANLKFINFDCLGAYCMYTVVTVTTVYIYFSIFT